jgi:hypothetical protein
MQRLLTLPMLMLLLLAGCEKDEVCNGIGSNGYEILKLGAGPAIAGSDVLELTYTGRDIQLNPFVAASATIPYTLEAFTEEFGKPGRVIFEESFDMQAGEERRITVGPADAFGDQYPSVCQNVTYTLELKTILP